MRMFPKIFASVVALTAFASTVGVAQATPSTGSSPTVEFNVVTTPTTTSIFTLTGVTTSGGIVSGTSLGVLDFLQLGDSVVMNSNSLFDFSQGGACLVNTVCADAIPNFLVLTDTASPPPVPTGDHANFDLVKYTYTQIQAPLGAAGNGFVNIAMAGLVNSTTGLSAAPATFNLALELSGFGTPTPNWSASGPLAVDIPEPPTLALLGAALLGLGFLRLRKRKVA